MLIVDSIVECLACTQILTREGRGRGLSSQVEKEMHLAHVCVYTLVFVLGCPFVSVVSCISNLGAWRLSVCVGKDVILGMLPAWSHEVFTCM